VIDQPCIIEGCKRSPQHAYGWCRAHYMRWRRYGDPLGGKPRYEECTVDGCDVKHYAHGWCRAHYDRWKHYGDPLGGPVHYDKCRAGDCERPIHIQGWCSPHYYRVQQYGDPHAGTPIKPFRGRERRWAKAPEKCSVEDCGKAPAARGLCTKHYYRWRVNGDPLKLKTRAKGEGTRYVNNQGYVVLKWMKKGVEVTVLEHRLVMEQVLGRELYPFENVHHKNGVKTDNDPGNLEIWVRSQPAGQRLEDQIRFYASHYPAELTEALGIDASRTPTFVP